MGLTFARKPLPFFIVRVIKLIKNKLMKILSILELALSPLLLIADDCKPCEEGEPNCGGNPVGDRNLLKSYCKSY